MSFIRNRFSSRVRQPVRHLGVEQLESRLLLAVGPPATMLTDINLTFPGSDPSPIVRVGDNLFFSGSDAQLGRELFVTNGIDPPEMVLDIMPGFIGSNPTWLTSFQNRLYFSANDGVHGEELWVSDGTPSGTRLAANLRPEGASGYLSSQPSWLTAAGGTLFFVATGDGVGRELWAGTGNSFDVVADINPNDEWSSPSSLIFVPAHSGTGGTQIPDSVYFSADDGVTGRELWRADVAGNVTRIKNIFPGVQDPDDQDSPPNSSNPSSMTLFQGEVFFLAAGVSFDTNGNPETDGSGDLISLGTELWKSDGTTAGTKLVTDIRDGTSSSIPSGFTLYDGSLFFAATGSSSGRELWKTDGQSAQLVRNIRAGSNSSNPSELTSVGGILFFAADGGQGEELWKYDGTDTTLVRDIEPGSGDSGPSSLTRLGDSVIFGAFNNVTGTELWISDGTEDGTVILKDTALGTNHKNTKNATFLVNVNDVIYFRANDRIHGRSLWRTDGTTDGTTIMDVFTFASRDSDPSNLSIANGLLYFAADDFDHGNELWVSDGTEGGTRLVKDIYPGGEDSDPSWFTALGDVVVFRATSETAGTELWVTDGTASGTTLLKDIYTRGSSDSNPNNFFSWSDRVLFSAYKFEFGEELWITDGTTEGTTLLKNLAPFKDSSRPREFTLFDSKVYFRAKTDQGQELWSTDGTAEGTSIVVDNSRVSLNTVRNLVVLGDRLLFSASDGTNGTELWTTDGTDDGTVLLKDIRQTPNVGASSNPEPLAVMGETLFFWANDGVSGLELWTTDGTPDNTALLKDIYPGGRDWYCYADTDDPYPSSAVLNGKLLFAADDGEYGCELWTSDGTPENTMLLADLIDGRDSEPANFTVIGDHLYFTAETLGLKPGDREWPAGRELWVSDGTAAGTRIHTDINQGDFSGSDPLELVEMGGTLFFVADDQIRGRELWTTSVQLDEEVAVNSTGDAADNDLNDGVCDTGGFVQRDGQEESECTLRAAIMNSNASGGEIVRFDIPAGAAVDGRFTIKPLSGLDEIVSPIVIDGTTQPGFSGMPIIEINGSDTLFGTSGLVISAGNSTVRGLIVNSFRGRAIKITGSGSNVIAGNFIGTDATGMVVDPDETPDTGDEFGNDIGIEITGSSQNRIGGQLVADRNVISGNRLSGVDISGSSASGNEVIGNLIGTSADGLAALGNLGAGIFISNSPSNRIGGDGAGEGNVISANGDGIRINSPGATLNEVLGNYIGTDITGEAALGNRFAGVAVINAPGNIIGAPGEDARNIISGNLRDGVLIEGSGATDNIVRGNYVGLNQAGEAALGNTLNGIRIKEASANQIGAKLAGEEAVVGNAISASIYGVLIEGFSINNVVVANRIGTNAAGTVTDPDSEPGTGDELGNTVAGVMILDSPQNRIGITLAGESDGTGNVIGGGLLHGITIRGADSYGNLVGNNFIGIDVSGTTALDNLSAGIFIDGAPDNVIGGVSVGGLEVPGNTISGNRVGVKISGQGASRNQVNHNLIGTDFEGNISDPTDLLGNLEGGVLIENAPNNIIGQRPENFDDECDPNSQGNTIAGNLDAGVRIDGDDAIGNMVRCNVIFANEGLGIDLASDGVTPNDPTDEDGSPNNFQNFPIISLIEQVEDNTVVSGTLGSTEDTDFVIDFYATDASWATELEHAQQGGRHLGSIVVTTDDTGYVSFLANLSATTNNEVITATATDAAGNSSEFSPFTPDLVGAEGFEVRTPVIVVPGIFGSFSPQDANVVGSDTAYREFLTTLGIHPDKLVLDPVANVYADLVITLQTAGYELGKDLFLAPYDWRINLAPITNNPTQYDGVIEGLTAESITDGTIDYGVEYLAFRLKQAAEVWFENYDQPLANVRIIAHSMGGVLSRSYMQSTAYGDSFFSASAGRNLPLPVVSDFITLGVPHQGGIGPWNGWHDNFGANLSYRLVLSKVLSHAWQKMQAGEVISGGAFITLEKADFEHLSERDAKILFVRRYAAGLGNLLPSWDGFGANFDPELYPEFENLLLADLNNRILFADRVAQTKTLYGTSVETPSQIKEQVYDPLDDLLDLSWWDEILSFTDYEADDPESGEIFFEEINLAAHGDGTVALESLEGLFLGDDRIELVPFCTDVCRPGAGSRPADRSVSGYVTHTGLVSNVAAQGVILDTLRHPLPPSQISTGSEVGTFASIIGVVLPWATYNIVVDPVSEAYLVDEQGNRLGFDADGPITEIDSSIYIGGSDGIGWSFGPAEGAVRLVVVGSGEDHFVQVTGFDEEGFFGVESTGFLADGETRTLDVVRLTGVPVTDPPAIILSGSTGDENDGMSQRFTWNVFSVGDELANVFVEIHKDGMLIASDTSAAGTFVFDDLGLGHYSISISASDSSGRVSDGSRSVSVIDDDTRSASIFLTGSEDIRLTTDTQEFGWTVNDDSGLSLIDVDITKDGADVFLSSAASGSFNFDDLGVGEFEISVRVNDGDLDWEDDSMTSVSRRSVVVVEPNSLVPPSIQISGSSGSEQDDQLQQFAWSVTDADNDLLSVAVSISRDGESVYSDTSDSGSFNFDGLGVGQFTIDITATDAQGATNTASQSVDVSDDDTAGPSIILTGSTGSELTSALQQFAWNVSDASGLSSVGVSVTRNDVLIFTASSAVGSFSFDSEGPGHYVIDVTATDADSDSDGDGTANIASRSVSVEQASPQTFQVVAFSPTPSGFRAEFTDAINTSALNLFIDQADVSLVNGQGMPVSGSLVTESPHSIEFIATGDVLSPGNYFAVIRSGVDAFSGADGALLDGNSDGIEGDDFTALLTIEQFDAVVVSIPDFARGPGQAVNILANASGLPVSISQSDGVNSVDFTFRYDPYLFEITAIELPSSLPSDWMIVSNLDADNFTPGELLVTAFGPTTLPGGVARIASIVASVPRGTLFGMSQVITIDNPAVNGGFIDSIGDQAIHSVSYLGDVDGDRVHTAFDASLIAGVVVREFDGFEAFASIDPVIIGNVSRTGMLNGLDASWVAQKSVDLDRPEIPTIPNDALLAIEAIAADEVEGSSATNVSLAYVTPIAFSPMNQATAKDQIFSATDEDVQPIIYDDVVEPTPEAKAFTDFSIISIELSSDDEWTFDVDEIATELVSPKPTAFGRATLIGSADPA